MSFLQLVDKKKIKIILKEKLRILLKNGGGEKGGKIFTDKKD